MHFRPELTGRLASGRRGLQVVSALYRATAISARADMHVEASIDHRPVGSRSDTEPRHAFRSRVDRRKRGSSEGNGTS